MITSSLYQFCIYIHKRVLLFIKLTEHLLILQMALLYSVVSATDAKTTLTPTLVNTLAYSVNNTQHQFGLDFFFKINYFRH